MWNCPTAYSSIHSTLNGVSKRRNRTLLDMVRSMMNLTTLPFLFWDYALEIAACNLNMVPTKKVDKTSHEFGFKCILVGHPKETMGYYFYFPTGNTVSIFDLLSSLKGNLYLKKTVGGLLNLMRLKKMCQLLKILAIFNLGGKMFKEMNLKMNYKLKIKRFQFVGPQGQYVLVID